MEIEIWLDIVCPWCYIGKRRFETALAAFEHADEVEVVLRSFELDPHAPATSDTSVAEILAAKYGGGMERARAMIANVTEIAAGEGLAYRLDVARRGNTFDAHRLMHLARDHGVQDAMAERLMRAYFEEGEPIGDRATLARLAGDAGIARDAAADVLAGDTYADAVRDDERTAASLGVQGVPCFVFDRRTGFSGAQPADVVVRALRAAWDAQRTSRSAKNPAWNLRSSPMCDNGSHGLRPNHLPHPHGEPFAARVRIAVTLRTEPKRRFHRGSDPRHRRCR